MATHPVEQEKAPELNGEALEVQEQQSGRDYEGEAREMGWVPLDEFKGDPSRWSEAKAFVEKGETIIPFMRKMNDHLKEEIKFLHREVKRLTKAEQRAYDNALVDLEARRRDAVGTGDVEAFEAIDKQIKSLASDMGEGDQTKHHSSDDAMKAFDDFRSSNPWFDRGQADDASEIELRAATMFNRLSNEHINETKRLSPADFLDFINEKVQAKFGDALKAKVTRAKPVSDVAGVSRPVAKGSRTGADLPAEAKAQAERFMRSGVYKVANKQEAYTRYAKSFDWDGYNKDNAR